MLGAVAAAASVTVMIPMDTIKTRLVIQVKLPKLLITLFFPLAPTFFSMSVNHYLC